jgi:DNA-binding beta-propeller fold protein YncE
MGGTVVVPIRTADNKVLKAINTGSESVVSRMVLPPDGRTLYAASSKAATVTPVRTATNKPGKPIALGGQAYEIVISPHGRTATQE